jgi:NTE family protein
MISSTSCATLPPFHGARRFQEANVGETSHHPPAASQPQTTAVDLVFDGGGVTGIGLIGALSVLEDRGYRSQNVAGASAGAVVATLHAAGYNAADLLGILHGLDLRRFSDRGWEDRIPLVGTPLSVLRDKGIYEGEAFLDYMRELLAAKGVRTFGDLAHREFAGDANPVYRYKVQVIASDLTERRLLVLPKDAPRLGIEPDDLEVALAVRMSTSIPVFFEPVRFLNPRTGREHLIVDGAMLSSFPVWLFDAPEEPDWPTFGLKLVADDPSAPLIERVPDDPPSGMGAIVDYAKRLVQTMWQAHDRLHLERCDFARTIPIPTAGVHSTEFDLAPERAEALHRSGQHAARTFLAEWSFETYIAEFRRGQEHRRRTVARTASGADTT